MRQSAADALVRIGTPAVPYLIEVLKDEHVGIIRMSMPSGRIGPDAKAADLATFVS